MFVLIGGWLTSGLISLMMISVWGSGKDHLLAYCSAVSGMEKVFLYLPSVAAANLSIGTLYYIESWFHACPFYNWRGPFISVLLLHTERLSRMEYGKRFAISSSIAWWLVLLTCILLANFRFYNISPGEALFIGVSVRHSQMLTSWLHWAAFFMADFTDYMHRYAILSDCGSFGYDM